MKFMRLLLEATTWLLLILPAIAFTQTIEFDENALIEAQTKGLTNSDQAKEIGEDWDNDRLNILYSNIDFKLKLFNHNFEASWFLRHSDSELYADERQALNYSLFPQKIVARDLFQTQLVNETRTTRTESVLNRFTYEFGDEEFKFLLGRSYVTFGDGYMANPINPFNLPQFSGTHAKFNQGNDGMQVKIQKDDRLVLKIYAFSDRSYREYKDERLTRTFMLHGDWQYKPDTKIEYILGEDQKRHKYGLQVHKELDQGFLYVQVVRFSQKLDKQEAYERGLNHYLAGVEFGGLSPKLTTRIEFGKQEFSEDLDEANHLSTTFIPLHRILALINTYQHSDKHRSRLVYAVDANSEFSLINYEYNYAPKENHDVFLRFLGPISKTEKDDQTDSLYTLQRVVATEATFGIRLFY